MNSFFFNLCSSYCTINKKMRHCFAITCYKCPQKYSLTLWSCTLLYMVRTFGDVGWGVTELTIIGGGETVKKKKKLSCDISRHRPQPMRVALQGSVGTLAPVLPFPWNRRTALVPCNVGDVGVSTYLAEVDWLLSHCSVETWKSSRKALAK